MKSTKRFILISFFVMVSLSVIIIMFFAMTMADKSSAAINDIGALYMGGMNSEINLHFKTIIDLRLNQVRAIIANNPAGSFESETDMLAALEAEGRMRGFRYLALMGRDGSMQMIYGDPITLSGSEGFVETLNADGSMLTVSVSDSYERSIALGVSTVYPMKEGKECTALVAGLPFDYIRNALSIERNGQITFTSIIDRDGNFIIKNNDEFRDNYFDRINDLYAEFRGKTSDEYIDEIKTAIAKGEDYSSVFVMINERRHLFISPMENTEWYLVTVMPYGEMDTIIDDLGRDRTTLLIVSVALLSGAFTVIFARYYSITGRHFRELEQAREDAVRASRAKSDFLSNMSHDIRTPMNAIVGMTAIAAANIDNKQQLQSYLKKISQSNKQLLGLINDILDMSKIENGKMTINLDSVSLSEVISDIVTVAQPQMKAKNQKLEVFIRDIISEDVYTDSVRLNQVLMNIVSNAMKFTPEGGSVTVSIYQEPTARSSVVRVHFDIKDTGIGMSEEFREKIFESFAREDNKRVYKTEGAGLGMAITKYIVDAMHGTINVRSEQGKGTEFMVTIDMEKAPRSETEMKLPPFDMLVVCDSELPRSSAAEALRELGVTADTAASGAEAVDMITARRDSGSGYKLVLMDRYMDGGDGMDTAKEILDRLGAEAPTVLIAAYDWCEDEERAKEAGVAGFVTKPLFKSTLYNALLPYSNGDGAASDIYQGRSHSLPEGTKVLVAEDNEINREVILELLSREGIDITLAENGKICLDTFSASEPGYYSAIIMDVRMPEMNGYEATKAIRALDRPDSDIPILAMTADAFSDDIKRCLDSGMNTHIAKPIDLPEVLRQLEKYVKK